VERAPYAIGDSVMLGAAKELYGAGLEVDAKGSRVMRGALTLLRRRGRRLPGVLVLAIGTNVPATPGEMRRALRLIGPERRLVLVTPMRSWRPFGATALHRAARLHHDQVRVVDWAAESAARPWWLWGDGTHLRPAGARAYARLVVSAVRAVTPPAAG
jgi:hypothetical protein